MYVCVCGRTFARAHDPTIIEKMLRTGLFWVISQRVLVISYRRFGITYRYYPQSVRMGPIGCTET